MSESDKKSSSDNTPSDKPPSLQAKCPDTPEPKKVSEFGNNFHSQFNTFIENLKNTFKKFLNTYLKKPITSDLSNVITATEKVIKNFYGQLVTKVTDFAENDLLKFKNMSMEETENTKKILLQYAADMQKISKEKLKQLMEANERLQKKVLKIEELYAIAKFFDMKMIEVKKLTEELCSSLSKKETAPFVKDFQKIMDNQSIAMKSSFDSFLVAAKKNIPKLQVSLNSISAKSFREKLPKILDKYKLPNSLSNIFLQKPYGCVKGKQTAETVKKAMVTLINKLQLIVGKFIQSESIYGRANSTMGHAEEAGAENLKGLAKYFNSQTNYGRANVSKATYAVTGLIIAYFYLRPSKKPAQK